MLYLASAFFVLTLLASVVAYGGGVSREVAEGAQYAAAMFAFAFFVSLVAAFLAPPKP